MLSWPGLSLPSSQWTGLWHRSCRDSPDWPALARVGLWWLQPAWRNFQLLPASIPVKSQGWKLGTCTRFHMGNHSRPHEKGSGSWRLTPSCLHLVAFCSAEGIFWNSWPKEGLKSRHIYELSRYEWELVHGQPGSILHSGVRLGWCWLWSREPLAHAKVQASVYWGEGGSLGFLSRHLQVRFGEPQPFSLTPSPVLPTFSLCSSHPVLPTWTL